jgi:hypothetical protein
MARDTTTVPRNRAFLKRSEVEQILGQTVLNDCLAAKWIKPVTIKKGKKRANAMILFSRADVVRVEERLNAGEYPGQKNKLEK